MGRIGALGGVREHGGDRALHKRSATTMATIETTRAATTSVRRRIGAVREHGAWPPSY